ncbi:alpha-hydroxy-acid oxidizing protein [Pseudaminobacter sp. 19-2017]|uniref:Alpha-hydroxy-acid oxidizing protein n=1 Tax=Pseudaminobacter soli (ex Zhang et al. 2022) TaxID=2831468 RepID=A0A942DV73_9HYPH|nr:alpha-hydroxy acid oxidase [Pseudaminobacter soli]MBS3647829.1 alpha-hydroxy-acid oxidizing protein [Pseudaminobacter soli]
MRKPPDSIASIEDLRRRAHRRVPKPFMEYVENGSFAELTLHANRAELDAIRLRERVMFDVSNRKLGTTMLGEPVKMPVAIAPTGMCGAVWSNGEILSCRAAQAFGIPFSLSSNALLSLEDVAGAVDKPFWFQLYITRDRGFSEEMINRARAAGCSALILTMDLHVEGTRYRDVHNGLGIPPRLTPSNVWSIISHPAWAIAMLHSKRWSFGNYAGRVDPSHIREMAELVKDQLDPSYDQKTVEWVRKLWPRKLILKGILDPEDARLAINAGADAVLVSNHGGRQLDGAGATASILPDIVEAVGDRTEVFADSGVRSGLDVLKFLGLGARACFIGRAYLYGLGAFGEAGVTKALQLLYDELDTAMALTGITDASSVPRSVILDAGRRKRQHQS